MRARNIWTSCSDVSVPLANATLTSAIVSASRSIVRCAERDVTESPIAISRAPARTKGVMAPHSTPFNLLTSRRMKRITRLAGPVLVIVLAATLFAQQPSMSMSIDTLMATPFPTDLVSAPTGGAIAWVSSNSGVHNILVAEPTPGTGPLAGRTDHKWRAVTNYTGDDGLWITEPGFTSDAKTIVYVRGDGANRQGESPNPAQLQDGTDQAVFAVPVAGGAPKRLGPGSGVVPSPRGQRVAWVSRGQIWSADLASA